jgi:hypothetical protein
LHPRSHEKGRLFNFRHICYGGYDRQVRHERKYLPEEAGIVGTPLKGNIAQAQDQQLNQLLAVASFVPTQPSHHQGAIVVLII